MSFLKRKNESCNTLETEDVWAIDANNTVLKLPTLIIMAHQNDIIKF